MCSDVRSRGTQLAPLRVPVVLAAWREYFEIPQSVATEHISRFQVTGETGRAGAALIGVTFDATRAIIYHTRALTVEDLIHELLHVAHPLWSEAQVVYETSRLWRPGIIFPSAARAEELERSAA